MLRMRMAEKGLRLDVLWHERTTWLRSREGVCHREWLLLLLLMLLLLLLLLSLLLLLLSMMAMRLFPLLRLQLQPSVEVV